jgi:SOS-response transcriptional repressor LexA
MINITENKKQATEQIVESAQEAPKKNPKAVKKRGLHRKPQALKLSTNLKTLMAEFPGLSVSKLAELTGLGQPVVHRICSGETDNPKVATLSLIANFFRESISALIGDVPLSVNRIRGSYSLNLGPYQNIPILPWKEVVKWCQSGMSAVQSHVLTLLTNVDVGQKGYAVVVTDTTMEPRFPEGTRLLINSDLKPRNRDFVVVHIEGEELPHFKQLLIDGKNYYLKPFNPDFRAFLLDKPYRFLGTMAEAHWAPMDHPVKFSKKGETS